tara:strand:- start:187 stop:414 length:228 start_codon:yes stop_codon:yes gene_type:complete
MNLEILFMNGYGIYVWSSFIFTFVVCLYFYLKTKKTLKKLEKNFIKETETLSKIELENLKKQKVVREILVSHSKN